MRMEILTTLNKQIMKRRGYRLMGFAKLSTVIPSEKETRLLVRAIRRAYRVVRKPSSSACSESNPQI